jgi:hypothetical protein
VKLAGPVFSKHDKDKSTNPGTEIVLFRNQSLRNRKEDAGGDQEGHRSVSLWKD